MFDVQCVLELNGWPLATRHYAYTSYVYSSYCLMIRTHKVLTACGTRDYSLKSNQFFLVHMTKVYAFPFPPYAHFVRNGGGSGGVVM